MTQTADINVWRGLVTALAVSSVLWAIIGVVGWWAI